MAQNARIAVLTDELIQSIVDFRPETNRQAYRRARDIAARALKPHQYNRTNQFEVRTSYEGLDEKFRVLNRDDLADALGERMRELEDHRHKWKPECLKLLLLLADRPTEDADVKALELLKPPEEQDPLTWKEILDEDPYSDEEIWKDIDYAEESSEDEKPMQRRKEKVKDSPPSSAEEDDVFDPETCVLPPDEGIIAEIKDAQFWKHSRLDRSEKIEITELQAVRETLFMLAGLETSLYLSDKRNASVRVNQHYAVNHAIPKTMDHLLSQLGEIGRDISKLRQWTMRPSSIPLVQTFEAVICRRLSDFDRYLADLQRLYLLPDSPTVVSLLKLHSEIDEKARPLLKLAQLVIDIAPSLLVNPFAHLERLFEQTTLAQMTLEKDVFDFFSTVFFECLQTYLKPIRQWMEFGELGANDETFFIFENDSGSDVASLWHDRFVLRRGQADRLRCPEFLHPAAQKIFNTGKSVIFLKELNIYDNLSDSAVPEPRLDHDAVCGGLDLPISPFPDLFQSAFDGWIRSKYSKASTMLRKHLFAECRLLEILQSYNILYLGANGSAFQDFANSVFERVDSKQRGWNDRFLLTELARGIYAHILAQTEVDRVVVKSVRTKSEGHSVKGLASVSIDYALPWSIMNVLQRSSIPMYQQVFTFLLQIYRAKYILQGIQLVDIRMIKDARLQASSYKLRHSLIWFADILRSYLAETVIARSIEDMVKAMEAAEDIDDMSNVHIKYLARLQEQALLADNLKPIHSTIIATLDLAVAFKDAHAREAAKTDSTNASEAKDKKKPARPALKSGRRKSVIPAIVEADSSDSDLDAAAAEDSSSPIKSEKSLDSTLQALQKIDQDFNRQLPFIVAGLRTIGRVGADPVWEMLADRLEWDKKKDR
ncbi:hypothetical protein BU24DRAFT_361990 [Aaosphaeria arxii CBS 175.79]|uniref:Spindle pole body component n=1 Tax=Aaosphaeria arxii CBS 175.79 TaxID=1450172 RepID=A0A6A5Y9V2_9PLEO|nr:uncharacterized protein BU24DRAFT_361990 [Aaosphaeria arxii CBS 175.79]KAF2021374.1 hypothetical protein BU24DRAFT_361990 [Aaosphaeria arxii CBS 175.79]